LHDRVCTTTHLALWDSSQNGPVNHTSKNPSQGNIYCLSGAGKKLNESHGHNEIELIIVQSRCWTSGQL